MLRVGYDAQSFLSFNGGTGKGLQLRNLLGPYRDDFLGFASTDPNPTDMPLIQEGFHRYNAWQQLSLPLSLRRHKVDLFLAPENTAPFFLPPHVRLILVLHDTILHQGYVQPTLKLKVMDLYRRLQIPASVKRAEIVLTVSEYSRSEILRLFPAANVRVIPCTIPESWYEPVEIEAREDFILLVTSSAPHKNAAGAFEGYARYACLTREPLPLKVVGLSRESHSYGQLLDKLGIRKLVSFIPFVPEATLRYLYRTARAVLIPSFAEGFGIPLLEAMASGAPVLASNAASLPEVGGTAPRYFDPKKPSEIGSALAAVMTDSSLRTSMATSGLERARRFHPSIIAKIVDQFWREIAQIW